MDIVVTMEFTSNKEVMWSKEMKEEEVETIPTRNYGNNRLSPKATAISKAL